MARILLWLGNLKRGREKANRFVVGKYQFLDEFLGVRSEGSLRYSLKMIRSFEIRWLGSCFLGNEMAVVGFVEFPHYLIE